MKRRGLALVVVVALLGAACSNGNDLEVLATVDGVEITIDDLLGLYAATEAPVGAEALGDFDVAGGLPLGGPGVAASLGTLIQIEAARDEALALGVETPVLDGRLAIENDIPVYLDALRIVAPTEVEIDQVSANLLDSRPCSRHILVDTEELGDDTLARIGAGEDFAALAAELSTDPGSGAQGGDLQCRNLGDFDPAFAAALSVLDVGGLSGVVESSVGFHIIERTPPPADLVGQAEDAARDQVVQDWFDRRALEAVVDLDPAIGTWNGTNIVAADPGANS